MPVTLVEEAWIEEVQKFFNEKEEDDMDGTKVSIFDVPNVLKAVKPEAYTPQVIAIGPYHHWREDLCAMERNKLIVAKKVQSLFRSLEFQDLVDRVAKKDHKIRACYHKYLKTKGEILSWMMAIDGLFLMQFLHIFVNKDESVIAKSDRMSFLVDSQVKNSIFKDIMMLENQIPFSVLKLILKIQCQRKDLAEIMFPKMLKGLCKVVAPLPPIESKGDYEVDLQFLKNRAHLLDILYHLMVPSCKEQQNIEQACFINVQRDDEGCLPGKLHRSPKVVFKDLWHWISKLDVVRKMKNGPLKVVSFLEPVISNISSHLGFSGEDNAPNEGPSNGDDGNNAPRVEEIMIPSVTQLVSMGVEFVKTSGDISSIKFDSKSHKFYLPVVKVNVYSEVILRNLVAYEASTIPDGQSLVLARYTELMNGIVDTAEDARILAGKNIIVSEFRYDDEVADLWNGMSKSIRLTPVGFIDRTIEDVNKYYHSTRKVRLYRAMKGYVYGSWRMLVFLATLLVLALMCLQSFCTVYDCPRVFHFVTEEK